MNAYQVDIQQNTLAWHAWRREGIGGSEITVVLGISPYPDSTVKRLVRQKLGLEQPTEFLNWAARRGQLLEPKARKMLAERLDVSIYAGCVEHRLHRHHRASLDGFWHHPYTGATEIAEFKALNHELHLLFGDVYDGRRPVSALPSHLLAQCQFQLYVSQAAVCYFCCYSEKRGEARQLHPIRLKPEPEYWRSTILPAVERFWDRLEIMRAVGYGEGGVGEEEFERDFQELFPEECERGCELPSNAGVRAAAE